MKGNIFTVMRKECFRIFNDRKLFVTAVLLPGIMMFVVYTFMGNFMMDMFGVDEEYVHQVHVINMPDSVGAIMAQPGLRLELIPAAPGEAQALRNRIENRETDVLLVFPPNFDALVAVFDPATATAPAPNVEVWSNAARPESQHAASIVSGILHSYHHALTHRFTVNAPTEDTPDGVFDLATDADIFGMVLGMMMPMMFLIFIFSSCMALAPEAIAGEKERGTLGGMLVTPARRSDLALGKILGISIFALLGAVGSIVGTILAMPSFLGIEDGTVLDFLSVGDLAMLLLVALTTTLVLVGLLSIMSAFAKSVKEANSYASVAMIFVMVFSFASMIIGRVPTEAYFYLIPMLNSTLSLAAVFSFEVSAVNMAITAGVNLVFMAFCVFVLARMFSSERIVFDK